MGEDCRTWDPQLHIDWQSPNLIPLGTPQDDGKVNCVPAFVNSGVNIISNGCLSGFGPSELPDMKLGHSKPPHGWFRCSPGFRNGLKPDLNFTMETFLVKSDKNSENISPNVVSTSRKRQFLVVDQSGDQTTFFLSPGFGSPIQCLTSTPKLESNHGMIGNQPLGEGHPVNSKGLDFMNGFDINQGNDVVSEMPDDTQEIDALFFSDEDCYSSEDDEVTSTGHSPSTMTKHYDEQEVVGGDAEEVASSLVKTKKRKSVEDLDEDALLADTASSLNVKRSGIKYEDVDESRCASGNNPPMSGDIGSLSGSKRMRKERIRDVLSALQSMIPGGKDKDPIMLLDEAIYRLKSLKLKAKLLGLDAY